MDRGESRSSISFEREKSEEKGTEKDTRLLATSIKYRCETFMKWGRGEVKRQDITLMEMITLTLRRNQNTK